MSSRGRIAPWRRCVGYRDTPSRAAAVSVLLPGAYCCSDDDDAVVRPEDPHCLLCCLTACAARLPATRTTPAERSVRRVGGNGDLRN